MQSVTLCPQDKVEDGQHDYHDQAMTIVDLAQGSLQKRTSQVSGWLYKQVVCVGGKFGSELHAVIACRNRQSDTVGCV